MKIGNKGPSLWQFYGIVGITGITGITGIATIHTEGAQFRNSHNSSESDNQTIGRGFFWFKMFVIGGTIYNIFLDYSMMYT